MRLALIESSIAAKIRKLLQYTVANGCTPEEEKAAKLAAAKLRVQDQAQAKAGIDLQTQLISRLSRRKPYR